MFVLIINLIFLKPNKSKQMSYLWDSVSSGVGVCSIFCEMDPSGLSFFLSGVCFLSFVGATLSCGIPERFLFFYFFILNFIGLNNNFWIDVRIILSSIVNKWPFFSLERQHKPMDLSNQDRHQQCMVNQANTAWMIHII